MKELTFFVNGKKHVVHSSKIEPDTTLIHYLRGFLGFIFYSKK